MNTPLHETARFSPRRRWIHRPSAFVAAVLVCVALNGCAALTNPVANGIPVRLLPPELLGESREALQDIPLTALRQKQPEVYRLAPGDVLGVWIEGVLGEKAQAPPVQYSLVANLPPSLGLPIPVRSDGTLTLPFVPPVKVEGMTVEQAQEAVREAYTVKRQVLQPGRDRIIVTLQTPRQYHVLVIREDSPGQVRAPVAPATRGIGFTLSPTGTAGPSRRGAGFAVDLPAYENDVLNALAVTGGLPGLDAINEVVIERGYFKGNTDNAADWQAFVHDVTECGSNPAASGIEGQIIRIPLRLRPGERLNFRPEDIVLRTGDIVYLKAREAELFYTGGFLPPGEYPLPRDYDLDVVSAVVRVGGPFISGGINPINLTGTTTQGGIGFPSPSQLSVVRRTPGGGQVVIRVDLNRAMRDPRERILVQPKDFLILQETPSEAFGRYLTNRFFNFNLMWRIIHGPNENGIVTINTP